MTAKDPGKVPASQHGGQNLATRPEEDTSAGPFWDVRVGRGGKLTATLVGIQPSLVVTADDEESLRKQVKTVIMRAML